MDTISLADQCKAIRTFYSISQLTLATWVGTTQTEISFIEHGSIPIDTTKVQRIEEIYNQMQKEKE